MGEVRDRETISGRMVGSRAESGVDKRRVRRLKWVYIIRCLEAILGDSPEGSGKIWESFKQKWDIPNVWF